MHGVDVGGAEGWWKEQATLVNNKVWIQVLLANLGWHWFGGYYPIIYFSTHLSYQLHPSQNYDLQCSTCERGGGQLYLDILQPSE